MDVYANMLQICGFDGVVCAVPLPPNVELTLDYLKSLFPGACGLQFKNPEDGVSYIGVFYDPVSGKFAIPNEIRNYQFQVIYEDGRPISPFLRLESPPLEPSEIEKFCFYILNIDEKTKKQSKMSVFCIDAFYFATYYHTTKISYKINETRITVYSKDWNEEEKKGMKFNTIVKHISIEQDFVLLKSDRQIFASGPVICEFPCSGSITLCGGYSGEVEPLKECKKSGDLQSSRTAYIKCFNEIRGPYFFGNVTSSPGDSGCAVFCPHGLKGMNIGVTNFPDCSYKDAFNKCAVYHPKCIIVPAIDMEKFISCIENEERKKAEKLAEVEEQFGTV
ncbi:hypothetical protein ACQ4LE_006312 [Meloidogyne hapla]